MSCISAVDYMKTSTDLRIGHHHGSTHDPQTFAQDNHPLSCHGRPHFVLSLQSCPIHLFFFHPFVHHIVLCFLCCIYCYLLVDFHRSHNCALRKTVFLNLLHVINNNASDFFLNFLVLSFDWLMGL